MDRARRLRSHDPADPESLPPGHVFSVLEDRSGTMWVGTGTGLAQLNRRTGKFRRIDMVDAAGYRVVDPVVLHVFEDRSGFIWVAAYGDGLFKWDPQEPDYWTIFRHDEDDPFSIPDDGARNVFEDQAGSIWVSTRGGGIARLDPVTGRSETYAHDPEDQNSISLNFGYTTHERRSEPGVIWVGTMSAGMNRIDAESGKVRHFTVEHGLPSNTVYAILEDERGFLWMSTNNGLSRLDPETETFQNFGLEVGLQSLEFNGGVGHRSRTGEMFFGGINGLNAFFPSQLVESSVPPEVRIVDIKVGRESIKASGAVTLEAPVPDIHEIKLSHDQKDLTFEFVGFHYNQPEKNTFSYQLEGYNDDWVDAGHSRTASFTNLAPGEYTFRVKAANSDGVWTKEDTALHIIIAPPWWSTWWEYGFYGLIFVSGIFGVDRVQRRRLITRERERAREKELEQAREIKVAYEKLDKSHEHLKQTQDRFVQSEKMASLGQLTAGIAHEIKNPLNFVNNFSDLSGELLEELSDEVQSNKGDLPDEFVEFCELVMDWGVFVGHPLACL
ncbi:MAG: two-component regulator propeller domain-containing protein, partial [Rhodothermia bacterium]